MTALLPEARPQTVEGELDAESGASPTPVWAKAIGEAGFIAVYEGMLKRWRC